MCGPLLTSREAFAGPARIDGPDLVVLPGPGYDPKGAIGAGVILTTGPLSGMHTFSDAVCLVTGEGPDRVRLEDVGASVLSHLGVDGAHLDGKPVLAAVTVPVDIVSGWLGAGKTTLLRRLLETGAAGRVAVVVNELGDIGIDGAVVTGLGFAERMVELTSGCICCQLDTVHFEIALEELIEATAPERVVIETTGVADPGALSARLNELGHHLGAVITVVDVAQRPCRHG